MRVVLRHKAFKALLRHYNPEVYKLLKGEYLDLNNGLEAVFRSAVMALHRHGEGLAGLYAKYQSGCSHPDFVRLNELDKEMAEAAKVLL